MKTSIKLLTVGILLLAALLGVTVAAVYLERQDRVGTPSTIPQPSGNPLQEHVIRVSGFGVASATSDMAYVTLAVETIAETASEAQALNADRMGRVISALKAMGIAEDDMETTGYYLNPNVDYESKPPRIVGYTCRNELRVAVEVSRAGAIIDAAVGAGANQVVYIEFTLSPHLREELAEKALESAARDAEVKARKIAETLNLKLKGPIQVELQSSMPTRPYEVYTLKAWEAETPITPGEVQVTATVTVAFAYE
ncbi:MAG: SIMPL domain-containing protein [Candidatus Bathyarchaeia archaeon]